MNSLERYNLTLYNLVEYDHPISYVRRVIEAHLDEEITKDTIINELKETPAVLKMVESLPRINREVYSLYVLNFFDINFLIIQGLTRRYKTLNDLARDYSEFKKTHYQDQTHKKIQFALSELGLLNVFDVEDILFQTIKEKHYENVFSLKLDIFNKVKNIKTQDFIDALDNLQKKKLISITFNGITLKKQKISEYFSNEKNYKDTIVYEFLLGAKVDDLAKQYNVTRQRIYDILNHTIEKYPIFENELEYFEIMSTYDFYDDDLEIMDYSDKLLIKYIKTKYKLNPKKEYFDYLYEKDMLNTKLGKKVLRNHNIFYINDTIVSCDIFDLFIYFINTNNIFDFEIDKIKDGFNKMLDENDIFEEEFYINKKNINKFETKLTNSEKFGNIKKGYFFYCNLFEMTPEFLDETEKYIKNFIGYGSVEYFYINNIELCNKNRIHNYRLLYAVLKKLYKEKYEGVIEFIKNPTLIRVGVDRSEYLEGLLYDLDLPCEIEKYKEYVQAQTGLKKETFAANFNDIICKHKDPDGLLTIDDVLTPKEYETLKIALGDFDCMSSFYASKLVKKYGFVGKEKIVLSPHILKKINYTKTNSCIYKDVYKNRRDAALKQISKGNYILTKSELENIADPHYFYYKCYDFIDTCALVRISNDRFLNILRRDEIDLVKNLRELLEDMVKDDEILTLNHLMSCPQYKQKIDSNEDFGCLLSSYGEFEIIKYLIMTSRKLSYLSTTNNGIVFSKEELTIKRIIYEIMSEEKCLYISNLKEMIYEEYKINNDLNNNLLSELGLYCPKNSVKVYLSKEYYKREMEANL